VAVAVLAQKVGITMVAVRLVVAAQVRWARPLPVLVVLG
jgi:hypothetical protein